MSKVNIVSKISAKKIVGKVKKPTETVYHMQVYGIATGTKAGESNFGPWTALTGQFRAKNLETGEVSQSGVCFLPEIALNLITPKLDAKNVEGVEFALNIGVTPANNSVGYEYVVTPVIAASENDPLEQLETKVNKVLPAPAPAEKHKKSA